MARRPAARASVEHVRVQDRLLLSIGPADSFWKGECRFEEAPELLDGAIVWLKPPPGSPTPDDVERAVRYFRENGATVRALPADSLSQAPTETGSEKRLRELRISDARECCRELAEELAKREGVPVADVLDVVEKALSAAGL